MAEIEAHGFPGVVLLWVTGFFALVIIRGTIRPRLILDSNGSIRDVGPFLEVIACREGGLLVRCESNGLMIIHSGGERGVWAFSQSLLGGRSARQACRFIDVWLKAERDWPSTRVHVGRRSRVHIRFVDVFLLVAPLAIPVLMKF
ncbi:hypothetical protein [Streptomyces rubiginosohelvolus]|uniref:hypothetical protein n=1 Tax=Streptomyces rubiginosohelvolus TaxID=67362 RepID=UPI0033A6A7C6